MNASTDKAELADTDRILATQAELTVRRWLEESQQYPTDASATRLAGVLKDPHGLDFTLGFIDTVVRPEDARIAGKNLHRLARITPRFLPWYLRAAIRLGGVAALVIPTVVVPMARAVLRRMVGHLIIDATPAKLGASLSRIRRGGDRLNLNVLGEAVLGEQEAARRLDSTRALLARDDVDYVSIKVSSVVPQLSMWAFDEMVDHVVDRLAPLYDMAQNSPRAKFINLDMEEYKDLHLTIAVFTKMLSRPELKNYRGGIVLQAYLPDALPALQELTSWAIDRRTSGGAAIKVRIVKGANLAMERIDATLHHWPLATWNSKKQSDAHYKRVLNWALTPAHMDAVGVGVAGHNLFDLAYAWHLAQERGVADQIEPEMLLGMATGQALAVKKDLGDLLLYTPVVHPREFDAAISYLVRRLEENASSENFMSAVFDLASDQSVFARERDRFLASLAVQAQAIPATHRTQNRQDAPQAIAARPFENVPDTDPSLTHNQAWAREILQRSAHSTLGVDTIEHNTVGSPDRVDEIVAQTQRAGTAWGHRAATERAEILHRAGDAMEAARGDIVEIMAHEAGKTIAEGDVEVSEAIDFAHYYAERACDLDTVEGATFVPSRVTVVTPPWNFPVAIAAGGILSALAAGSGVIIKPARLTQRSAAVVVEALWRAGVPRDVLTLVSLEERTLGQKLVAHPAVDRVILTGAWETAAMFRSWRADLPILAETSGKNAMIVTPSADIDLAVADLTRSAFGHAGQKCSAASLVILVGSVGQSERFERQLVDSVRTLRVGLPQQPETTMGPLVEAAHGKLLRALTTLGPGERWLVEPRQLDDEGKLWTPGVRDRVAAGSEFHLTEYFGPVLGIMRADTLDDALAMQNAVDYGLTAGLHSLDAQEAEHWLERVEAGNLYVNRGTTGAVVRRQPFGGWKRSTVGPSMKAGGPNYLMTLGTWKAAQSAHEPNTTPAVSAPVARVLRAAETDLTPSEGTHLARAAQSDQSAWETEFGVHRDVSNLGVERNVFRYRPAAVTIRANEDAALVDTLRVLTAAIRAGATVRISSAHALSSSVNNALRTSPNPPSEIVVESDAQWLSRAARERARLGRVRLIGGSAKELSGAVDGEPDVSVWAGEVTTAGRVELLVFLREQSLSLTAHRFGNPDPAMTDLAL